MPARERKRRAERQTRARDRVQELLSAWSAHRRLLRHRVMLIRRLLRTPAGRRRLRWSVYHRLRKPVWGLAIVYRRTLIRRARLVAVVGSFGKTTTTRAVAVALGLPDAGHAGGNAGVVLADHLLRVRPGARHAVVEVGIADKGQMERFARRLRPDIAVATCVGSEHLSSLGSLDVTRAEKGKMVAAIPPDGFVILNGDDPNVLWMKMLANAPVITYGFCEMNDVRGTDVIDDDIAGVRFLVHVDGEVYDVRSRLLGRHMVRACLAGVAVARAEGLDVRRAIEALEQLEPTRNRLQPIRLESGAWILLDAYKGALETIEAALDTLSRLPARRKTVVIGDVEEPPGSQGPIYKALARRLAEVADAVIFIGGKTNFGRLKAGMISGRLSRDALCNLRNDPKTVAGVLAGGELGPDDLVLIKGRSTHHMERVALLLTGKSVTCSAQVCRRRHDCATCPLL